MCLSLDEASEKLLTDINLPSLMPDEDNNFGGSFGGYEMLQTWKIPFFWSNCNAGASSSITLTILNAILVNVVFSTTFKFHMGVYKLSSLKYDAIAKQVSY